MSNFNDDLEFYPTKFNDLNCEFSDVDESSIFASLTSLYNEEEFTTEDINRNFKETDEKIWGIFGSLVSKGIYESIDDGGYRLSEKGEHLSQAVDEEETLKIMASPQGYEPRGHSATVRVGVKPEKGTEDTDFTADALKGYEE